MTPVDLVLARLEEHDCKPKRNGDGWSFRCPCGRHKRGDRKPSGRLGEGDDGRALLWCGAGGTADEIVPTIGLSISDLFPNGKHKQDRKIVATYDYTDADGTLLYQVVRYFPKDFRQRRPDGQGGWTWKRGATPVLYQLPAVLAAVEAGDPIYVVEGEKDADAINADPETRGIGTTNSGGSAKWDGSYADTLRGASSVVVVQDKDDPGKKHARDILASLKQRSIPCELREAKTGKDAADHLAAGHTLADLVLIDPDAPPYKWLRVSVSEMLAGTIEPIPWRVEGILAEDEVCVLSGQPKDGKSYLLQQLSIDAALGRPVGGLFHVERPCRVLWIDEEMGRRKLQRRLQRMCADLTPDEICELDTRLDIRPQQGLSLSSAECLDALRYALDRGKHEIVIMDSLAALQIGEENSATERRRFYNRILAPLKIDFGCSILIAAHPPLPSKEAHGDAKKRPRGSGDIVAQVDRAIWIERSDEERTATSYTFRSRMGPYRSREGGDLSPAMVVIEGLEDQPIHLSCEWIDSIAGVEQIGRVNACQLEILTILRDNPDRMMYQPRLVEAVTKSGFHRQRHYYPAIKGLHAIGHVGFAPAPPGKAGKWVELRHEDEA